MTSDRNLLLGIMWAYTALDRWDDVRGVDILDDGLAHALETLQGRPDVASRYCPECGTTYTVWSCHEGQAYNCPECGEPLTEGGGPRPWRTWDVRTYGGGTGVEPGDDSP